MDHPAENAPLATGSLAGSEEVLVPPQAPQRRGGSNSRAFKIAGLTTLACLLLASQVFTAYMVFDQKQQIRTIQKNSDRLGRQLSRSSQAMPPAKMSMSMGSLPLLMDSDEAPMKESKTSNTPLTKLEDTAVVSVEKQLMALMQDFKLPEFNETFLPNMQSLKQQINESEWKSFEAWMHYWLIFQMAQQKPAPPPTPTAPVIKTKCQMEAAGSTGNLGSFKPQCDEEGRYLSRQCWHSTGFCWCVNESGSEISGTAMRGRPDCEKASRGVMAMPRMMEKTLSFEGGD